MSDATIELLSKSIDLNSPYYKRVCKLLEKHRTDTSGLEHIKGVIETANRLTGVKDLLVKIENTQVDIVAMDGAMWVKVRQSYGKDSAKLLKAARKLLQLSKQHCIHFQPPQIMFVFINGASSEAIQSLKQEGVFLECPLLLSKLPMVNNCKPTLRLNVDTTFMIAWASYLTWTLSPEPQFTAQFAINQMQQECRIKVLPILQELTRTHELFACESAIRSFQGILGEIGGPREKQVGSKLLERIVQVQDNPSDRVLELLKNMEEKQALRMMHNMVVFGTGDRLRMTTITSNENFVRSCRNKSVELSVIFHPPRSLVEQKLATSS